MQAGATEGDIPRTPYKDDSDSEEEEEEIAAVEMILETYFMHVDNTYNKLQTLCEYIDDTEVRLDSTVAERISRKLSSSPLAYCCAKEEQSHAEIAFRRCCRIISTLSWIIIVTSSFGYGPMRSGLTSLLTLNMIGMYKMSLHLKVDCLVAAGAAADCSHVLHHYCGRDLWPVWNEPL